MRRQARGQSRRGCRRFTPRPYLKGGLGDSVGAQVQHRQLPGPGVDAAAAALRWGWGPPAANLLAGRRLRLLLLPLLHLLFFFFFFFPLRLLRRWRRRQILF